MSGETYDGLTWLDKNTAKPTKKETVAGFSACESSRLQKKVQVEQAKIDLNTKTRTDAERIDAIIKYLGLDK